MSSPPARTRNLAVVGASIALGCAFLETAAAFWTQGSAISAADWSEVATALDPELPTVIAESWLDPRARMEISALADRENLGRADLRAWPEFQVVGLAGVEGWSRELEQDLEGGPLPILVENHTFGGLALSRWSQADRGAPLDDLYRSFSRATIAPRRSRVELGFSEVDYRARHCLKFALAGEGEISISIPDFAVGNTIRGHLGFADFNARLRSNAPATLELAVSDQPIFRAVFMDEQGWAPFSVATRTERATLRLTVRHSVPGTWQQDDYALDRPRVVCVELRSFAEDGSP